MHSPLTATAVPGAPPQPRVAPRLRPAGHGANRLPAWVDQAALLDLSPQALCVADLDGTVLWCNAAFGRVLGRSPGGLTGVRVEGLVPPDGTAASPPGRDGDAPGPLRLRVGSGPWVALEGTVRTDALRGRTYLATGDVTEAPGDDATLGESAVRLEAIMKHSPSVVFVKDLDGRYLVVNDEFARAAGISVEEAVGRTTEECWPLDAPDLHRRERRLLVEGGLTTTEERLHTADGERDFVVSRFLLRDEGGAPYALGGIATDLTERLVAEKALATRDKLLDSVIKASPDMITLIDEAGTIHQISEARSAVFGYPNEEFTGGRLFDFVHPEDRDDVASVFVRLATGAVPQINLRYRVHHAEGHWVTVDSRAQAVLDGEGRFAGAVVVSRDISAQLEAEERLQASRLAVEQASKAKSDFLSRMSHELRTPLNSVLGFAQLLQMDDLPLAQADAVDHVLRAGRHLLDLIDEVLDIARIESGHLELTPTPVPLAGIVGEAVELTNPMAARAEVAIRAVPDPLGLVATADRQRLMQVLLNLLSNAVKYNRPGGRVEVTCEPGHAGRVRVAVADTGRGILPEHLDRVFVPFDRLGAEQAGIEGTGVGLALSHHLCERMGGALGVDSVPEIGSTFTVDLPAADAGVGTAVAGTALAGAARADPRGGDCRAGTATDAAPGGSAVLPDGRAQGPGHSFRVLLVEDNLSTLDLVERVVSRRPGTEVLAAMQGGLGVELAREHLPDLVLLDLHLPDMAGATVLDRLAADPATAGIPVAVVASDAPAHEVRVLLSRGVIGVLAKPIDVRGLLSLVDAVRAARGN